MEVQILLEADQHIPYPLEEINLDFQTLGTTLNSTTTVDVLLAASKSENIEDRSSAAEIGGLKTKIVDIEPYTVERAFSLFANQIENHGAGKTVAVVDIGATMTSLNVIFDKNLIYTREQTFGGRQLTEDIMRRYGLSYEDAGRAKRNGGLPENYEAEVLEPFKQTMAQQVSRFLQFFFSAGSHDKVDHVMLAGDCATIPGTDEFIQQHIGTRTTAVNPFAGMQLAPNIQRQQLYADAPSLMLAAGLALRRFD